MWAGAAAPPPAHSATAKGRGGCREVSGVCEREKKFSQNCIAQIKLKSDSQTWTGRRKLIQCAHVERGGQCSQHSCSWTSGDAGLETVKQNRPPIPSRRADKPHAPWLSALKVNRPARAHTHTDHIDTHQHGPATGAHTQIHTDTQRGDGSLWEESFAADLQCLH